jgi:hypothetical protein
MAKPKKVNFRVLDRKDHDGQEPYRILDDLVAKYRRDLTGCRIALAWRFGWGKPNADGLMTLGRCMKSSDLHRSLHLYDFVILLNHFAWPDLDEKRRTALIHHEITHIAVAKDKNGDPKEDADGNTVYRLRKHDLEEFRDIVEIYGMYKQDIEEFVAAAQQKKDTPLLRVAAE